MPIMPLETRGPGILSQLADTFVEGEARNKDAMDKLLYVTKQNRAIADVMGGYREGMEKAKGINDILNTGTNTVSMLSQIDSPQAKNAASFIDKDATLRAHIFTARKPSFLGTSDIKDTQGKALGIQENIGFPADENGPEQIQKVLPHYFPQPTKETNYINQATDYLKTHPDEKRNVYQLAQAFEAQQAGAIANAQLPAKKGLKGAPGTPKPNTKADKVAAHNRYLKQKYPGLDDQTLSDFESGKLNEDQLTEKLTGLWSGQGALTDVRKDANDHNKIVSAKDEPAQAKGTPKTDPNQQGGGKHKSGTVHFLLNGKTYAIPSDQVDEFLKDNPSAKRK